LIVALLERLAMALGIPHNLGFQVRDTCRQLGRALCGRMNSPPQHMAQHVDFAENSRVKILRDVTVGFKGPVGTRNTSGAVLALPDLLQLLFRLGAANDPENTFMAAIEQLLHGARKWPVAADCLHEMRVKIIGLHAGIGTEPAALEDAKQVRMGQAGAHDGALHMISQFAHPEAAPLRQTTRFIGNRFWACAQPRQHSRCVA